MKRIKILVAVLLVLMVSLAFAACFKDEVTLINEYKSKGVTNDATPLSYVTVTTIVSNSKDDMVFSAADFSVVRNGVKENGTLFITGFSFSEINGEKTYVSTTAITYTIKNNEGSDLQIVFSGTDNITELYYKTQKIELK